MDKYKPIVMSHNALWTTVVALQRLRSLIFGDRGYRKLDLSTIHIVLPLSRLTVTLVICYSHRSHSSVHGYIVHCTLAIAVLKKT